MFAYMGGKKVHSKWISPYIPSDFKTYVEVFGGAMWLYWMSNKVPVETNVYNDFNRHLSNIFYCASSDPNHFREVLESYVGDLHNDELFEEYKTDVFDTYDTKFIVPDFPLAAKYVFLQTQTFAGNTNLTKDSKIYKHPDKDVHGRPYTQKFISFINKMGEGNYLKKLHKLSVENMDCRELIKKYDSKDTFFYIDPPYYNMESYYTSHAFGHDDHMELCEMLKTTKGRWALSYYHFDELGTLFPRHQYVWHHEKTYSVNARVSTAERIELLIMNYKMGLSFL